MKRLMLIAVTTAAVAATLGAGTAPAADVTLKIAHESPPSHPVGVFSDAFKAAVEKRSNGRIAVEVFPQGQLYKTPRAATEAAVAGIIQISVPSTGYVSTIVPAFEVVDLPMMFKDDKTFYAFQDGPIGQELLKMVEAKGLKGLGYVSNVPLDLFATKRIASVADFAGKKVRAHSALLEHTVKALGGNPVAMPASEMFLAFQRGVIDGGFTTVTFAAPNKYQEVTKYVTRAAVSAIAYPVLMNLAAWNRLPNDLRNVVTEATKETIAANRAEIGTTADKAVATLKAGGAEIIELTVAQRSEWHAKLQAVYDEATPRIGVDLVKRARAAGS